MPYVSITGLQVRHFWQTPIFWRHAVASMTQAQRADGCLKADARTIKGIHHTRSLWRDREAMRAYLSSGAHLEAMRIFSRIATGKTFGFEDSDLRHQPLEYGAFSRATCLISTFQTLMRARFRRRRVLCAGAPQYQPFVSTDRFGRFQCD